MVQKYQLQGKWFDLIFMDCNMPVKDGFQASLEIKDIYHQGMLKKNPYICALTAYQTQGFMDKCFKYGMDGFLSKPVKTADIKVILKRFIPQ